jgi:hypothetical protein
LITQSSAGRSSVCADRLLPTIDNHRAAEATAKFLRPLISTSKCNKLRTTILPESLQDNGKLYIYQDFECFM